MNNPRSPVFIISPIQRSGINFLAEVLKNMDNSFHIPPPLSESYYLKHSDLLQKYSNLTIKRHKLWMTRFTDSKEYPHDYVDLLLKKLGDGIIEFSKEFVEKDNRLLLKCPDSENFNNFFKLFPDVQLIILVRDGRDTVASGMKSWRKWFLMELLFGKISKTWSHNTRLIMNFMSGPGKNLAGKFWLLVKYESLITNLTNTVENLAEFLHVNPEHIGWANLENIPVIGSSTFRGNQKNIHWMPVEKTNEFIPIGKWRKWSLRSKKRFKKIAGKELIELGYESDNSW